MTRMPATRAWLYAFIPSHSMLFAIDGDLLRPPAHLVLVPAKAGRAIISTLARTISAAPPAVRNKRRASGSNPCCMFPCGPQQSLPLFVLLLLQFPLLLAAEHDRRASIMSSLDVNRIPAGEVLIWRLIRGGARRPLGLVTNRDALHEAATCIPRPRGRGAATRITPRPISSPHTLKYRSDGKQSASKCKIRVLLCGVEFTPCTRQRAKQRNQATAHKRGGARKLRTKFCVSPFVHFVPCSVFWACHLGKLPPQHGADAHNLVTICRFMGRHGFRGRLRSVAWHADALRR